MGHDYRVVNAMNPDVTKAIFETDDKDDVLEWVVTFNPDIRNLSVYLHADGREFVSLESFIAENMSPAEPLKEMVNHPSHYQFNGVEIIDLVEQMNFCRGSAVKYTARAGRKNKATEIEDLKKAIWCLQREVARLEREND